MIKIILGLVAVLIAGTTYWNYTAEVQPPEVEEASGVNMKTDNLDNYVVSHSDFVDGATLIASASTQDISDVEKAGLIYMREEEKLARDVYLTLYDTWGANIFQNISASEQTHMDAVLTILNRYQLTDPATESRGVFTNTTLQNLYTDLVAEGSKSLAAAYVVGATIEDLDINDLAINLSQTDNADIKLVYEQLQKGSRNHLRAFNRQILISTGENYQPEYISASLFAEIIGSEVERGGGVGQAGQQSGGGQGRGRN